MVGYGIASSVLELELDPSVHNETIRCQADYDGLLRAVDVSTYVDIGTSESDSSTTVTATGNHLVLPTYYRLQRYRNVSTTLTWFKLKRSRHIPSQYKQVNSVN